MDNGDNIITFADLEQRANGSYYFSLTSDRTNLTLSEGLGLIEIIGNGHSITGSGSVGVDLGTTNYGIRMFDLNITGEFTVGMQGFGLHDAIFCNVDVANANEAGMRLHGDGMLVRYPNISNIGSESSLSVTSGIEVFGNNNWVDVAEISGLHSAVECYGVGFNQYGATNNLLSNSTLAGGSGWDFTVWDRTTGSSIENTYSYNFSWVAGSVYGIEIKDSTIDAAFAGMTWTADQDTFIFVDPPTTPGANGWLWGTAGRDHIGGSAGDDTVNGLGGNDVVFTGYTGTDTLIFVPDGQISTWIDFAHGEDLINVDVYTFASAIYQGAAQGSGPCMVWNAGENLLEFDTNGAAAGGFGGGIYLPYATTVTAGDLVFS